MRIGIFGGSFNPPHKFHERIASYLVDNNYVDKVIFVPTGSKYQYKKNLLSDEHRLQMINLMIEKYPFMESDTYELKNKQVYTWETLRYFEEKYPNNKLYFICGTDNLTYIDKWEKGGMLLKKYQFLILKRRTDNIDEILTRYEEYQNNFIIVDLEENDLSSTYIRDNIKDNNIHNYLDSNVYNYIKENDLYR